MFQLRNFAHFRNGIVAALIAGISLTTVGGGPVFADEIQDWRKKLAKRIAKKHIYPRSALSREIEGKARVKVVMDREGVITSFEVIQPSGESILDKAIPKMMKKLTPLPPPPANLPAASLTLVIPITWRLQ